MARIGRLVVATALTLSRGPALGGCTNSLTATCAGVGEFCTYDPCCAQLQCKTHVSGGIMGRGARAVPGNGEARDPLGPRAS
jgi:hypothetical protein